MLAGRVDIKKEAGHLPCLLKANPESRHLGSLLLFIRALADKNYALLKENPRHPPLQLKKVGCFWSVRVGSCYRALAVDVGEGLLCF